MINSIRTIAAAIAAVACVVFIPSTAISQASDPGQRLEQRLVVADIELSPSNYRTVKAFSFSLMSANGSMAGCGTATGARPTWYFVERCKANDSTCDAAVDSMYQLLMSAKLARLPVAVHATKCKVEVLRLW